MLYYIILHYTITVAQLVTLAQSSLGAQKSEVQSIPDIQVDNTCFAII